MKFIAAGCSLIVFSMQVCFLSCAAASDAFVSTDEQFGQGFFRSRETECFFITAGHVVEDAVDVTLTTSSRKNIDAVVLNIFPADIAILKIDSDDGKCPPSSWDDGKSLSSLLTVYKEGIVKTKLNDGSTLQTPVLIKKFNNYGYIQVVPKDADTAFAKGFSGSPLYIAGKAAGMLLSVKNGVGRVFRQDALNNTLALFFQSAQNSDPDIQSSEKNAPQGAVNEGLKQKQPGDNIQAQAAEIKATATKTVNKSESELDKAFASQQAVKGEISKDQVITYKFQGRKNSPLLFRFMKKWNRDYYQTQILNSRKDVVKKSDWVGGSNYEWLFTPPEEGTYTLQLTGGSHHDAYEFSVHQYTTDADLTGPANVVKPGDTANGVIAPEAVATYKFQGRKNSPLLFRFMKKWNRDYYQTQILNSRKDVVKKSDWVGGSNYEWLFTPPEEGTYTLQLTGGSHHDAYEFSVHQYTTDADLTGPANVVKPGDTANGVIAPEAVAMYKFQGRKNSPLLFRFMKKWNRDYYQTQILNSRKDVVKTSDWVGSSNYEWLFTPSEDDTYTLQLTGGSHHDAYEFLVDQYTTNADLTGQANVLKPGDTAVGVIAPQAVATYKFQGQKNNPLLFRFMKRWNRDYYQSRILNSRQDVVKKCGWVGGSNYDWAFTPPEDGTYILQLTGGAHHDKYEFELMVSPL